MCFTQAQMPAWVFIFCAFSVIKTCISSRKSLAKHVNIILVSLANTAKTPLKNDLLDTPTAKTDNKMQYLFKKVEVTPNHVS
jgi:hypothetical protein